MGVDGLCYIYLFFISGSTFGGKAVLYFTLGSLDLYFMLGVGGVGIASLFGG